jgi:hypothetical protein
MGTTEIRGSDATSHAGVGKVDMKLEVGVIPVSNPVRSKQFYESLGWSIDADIVKRDDSRVVQVTPPGSGCSIGRSRCLP